MLETVLELLGRGVLLPSYKARLRRFIASHDRATETRARWLAGHVGRAAETQFGRRHGLAQVRSPDDFRQVVPIVDHAALEPYLAREAAGERGAILPPDEEILAFASTTGSTGVPKLLPVTRSWLSTYQDAWRMWGAKAVSDHPGIIGKKWLQVSGPFTLGHTPSGLPVGMVSAISARYQSRLFQLFFYAPSAVGDIDDGDLRSYVLARLGMARPVGFMITITAANLIRLARAGNDHKERIIRDIYDGTLDGLDRIEPASLRADIASRLTRNRGRARELERLAGRHAQLHPRHYWSLEQIACWIGGTVGHQARELPHYFGDTPVRDVGYVSTEGRHTVPMADGTPSGLLVADGLFHEFEVLDGSGVLLPHELEQGREYGVVVTAGNGLFRVRLGDIVRCDGHVGQSPLLRFIRKTSDYSDLEGEKLSAGQVVEAVTGAASMHGLALGAFSAVAERPPVGAARYRVLVEAEAGLSVDQGERLAAAIDQRLISANLMYAQKRRDRSLDRPLLEVLPAGTWERFAAGEAALRRTGEMQFKHPVLLSSEQAGRLARLVPSLRPIVAPDVAA